jgi:hypothetical protein
MKRSAGIAIILALAVGGAGIVYWLATRPAPAARGAGAEAAAEAAAEAVADVPAAKGARGLSFAQTLLELSVAADAKTTVADFAFVNHTADSVVIDRVEKTCTCLSVQVSGGKLQYAPGEKGVIRATFELDNLVGEVEKSLTLFLAGDPADKPSHTLAVRVRIPVLVNMSDKTLKWSVGGKPERQKIDIEMVHTKPIRVLSTQCSMDGINLELKTIEDGHRYELWVTPASTAAPMLALIRLETDCEIPRHRVHQVFALIRRPQPGEEAAR